MQYDPSKYQYPFTSQHCVTTQNTWTGKWDWPGETKILREKHVPVPFWPPKIPHRLVWDWTQPAGCKGDNCCLSHDTANTVVSTVTRLGAGWSGVWLPADARQFSLFPYVQTYSGAHPASYSRHSAVSLPVGELVVACSWQLIPTSAKVKKEYSCTLVTPACLHYKHKDNFRHTVADMYGSHTCYSNVYILHTVTTVMNGECVFLFIKDIRSVLLGTDL